MSAAIFILFHSCIHGSDRKKLTALLTNRAQFQVLAGYCQGDHEHLPWRHTNENGRVIFDTSKEAAYPKLFCERFANVLADMAGIADSQTTGGLYDKTALMDARVATHTQPRGRKIAALVPEYAQVQTVRTPVHDEPLLSDKRILLEAFAGVPAGSKLLRFAKAKRGNAGDDTHFVIRVFGIYRTLNRSPLETMKLRLETIRKWRCLADLLSDENNQIFSNMDAGCSLGLKGKHLALLEKLATDYDWRLTMTSNSECGICFTFQ